MKSNRSWQALRGSAQWAARGWQALHGGAVLLVLALSPSSYGRANRPALARQLYFATVPLLPGFTVLAALISLILIRIVVVTATSYGLSHYALEMVVRVLVLELIPLSAALYVSVRCTVPGAAELARRGAHSGAAWGFPSRLDPIRRELVPRVIAGSLAVLLFAGVACLLATLLTYLAVYGVTLAAFAGFTRSLGQIFNPGVALIFGLKTALFSAAVALIPAVALLRDAVPVSAAPTRAGTELASLVRVFSVVLLIEALSLVGNYH